MPEVITKSSYEEIERDPIGFPVESAGNDTKTVDLASNSFGRKELPRTAVPVAIRVNISIAHFADQIVRKGSVGLF